MENNQVIFILNRIVSCYSIVLAWFGTLGNLLSTIVCLQKSLRKTPTFIFISFMVNLDSLSLYFWNFNSYYLSFYGISPMDESELACKMTNSLQMFSLQGSAYFLV